MYQNVYQLSSVPVSKIMNHIIESSHEFTNIYLVAKHVLNFIAIIQLVTYCIRIRTRRGIYGQIYLFA